MSSCRGKDLLIKHDPRRKTMTNASGKLKSVLQCFQFYCEAPTGESSPCIRSGTSLILLICNWELDRNWTSPIQCPCYALLRSGFTNICTPAARCIVFTCSSDFNVSVVYESRLSCLSMPNAHLASSRISEEYITRWSWVSFCSIYSPRLQYGSDISRTWSCSRSVRCAHNEHNFSCFSWKFSPCTYGWRTSMHCMHFQESIRRVSAYTEHRKFCVLWKEMPSIPLGEFAKLSKVINL